MEITGIIRLWPHRATRWPTAGDPGYRSRELTSSPERTAALPCWPERASGRGSASRAHGQGRRGRRTLRWGRRWWVLNGQRETADGSKEARTEKMTTGKLRNQTSMIDDPKPNSVMECITT
ncbi:hypothetical protein PR202_gb25524 [Eleusine coracana subsp. coracana]|uniref:Uncharacterized protein n=1 Tax=Eleusine coracana subsp. coracana TaxID=191504 RepID=A0AAV5FLU9_ELECO|nr:hypothetical protein PR202_gb25524 [Eleusine coracana subsp. coracana]